MEKRRRSKRETTSMDFGDCTLHIIKNAVLNTTKTELKLALDCPTRNASDTNALLKQICGRFFESSGPTVVEECGRSGEMEKKKVFTCYLYFRCLCLLESSRN